MSAAITIKISEATPARQTGIGLSKMCHAVLDSFHTSFNVNS